MEQVVTITSQGQLTIPRSVRKHFGMVGSTKASLHLEGNAIVVKPKNDFWSLAGVLSSSKHLTDAQLKRARKTFSKQWKRQM